MGIVDKLVQFENQHASVFIWLPHQSISGSYEALVGSELVMDTNGRRFLHALREAEDRRNQEWAKAYRTLRCRDRR